MSEDMRNKTRNLILSSLFAAIIMIFTAYIKFNTGINQGYVHFGDAMIYLAACLLPSPYAISAAAIGGALADILAGVPIWAPITAVIKALNVLPFAIIHLSKFAKNKIICIPNIVMSVISGVITVFGYFFAEMILFSFESACLSIPFSIIQAVGSSVVFCVIAAAMDCVKLKNRIYR